MGLAGKILMVKWVTIGVPEKLYEKIKRKAQLNHVAIWMLLAVLMKLDWRDYRED